MRKAIVITSPSAGRATSLATALLALRQAGVALCETLSIEALDMLPPQGSLWREKGIDVAIATGGDGTVNGVLRHIIDYLPLGIMPLGTANDIARSLGIPHNLNQAARVIASGNVSEKDLGVVFPAPLLSKKEAPPMLWSLLATLSMP